MKYKTFYRSLLGHSIPAGLFNASLKNGDENHRPPPISLVPLSHSISLSPSPSPSLSPALPFSLSSSFFLHFASFVSLSIELFFFFLFFSFSRVFFFLTLPVLFSHSHSDSHTFHASHTTRLTLSRFKNLHTAIILVQGNHDAKFSIDAAKTLFDPFYTIKFIPFSYHILPFIPSPPLPPPTTTNEALSADGLVKARSSFGKTKAAVVRDLRLIANGGGSEARGGGKRSKEGREGGREEGREGLG